MPTEARFCRQISAVSVFWPIPTNEEMVIARAAAQIDLKLVNSGLVFSTSARVFDQGGEDRAERHQVSVRSNRVAPDTLNRITGTRQAVL